MLCVCALGLEHPSMAQTDTGKCDRSLLGLTVHSSHGHSDSPSGLHATSQPYLYPTGWCWESLHLSILSPLRDLKGILKCVLLGQDWHRNLQQIPLATHLLSQEMVAAKDLAHNIK